MRDEGLDLDAVIAVAEFRAALRSFLRQSERIARRSDLTPQRYLLLLMIKGAPDGSEVSTVTELARRLQLAQSTVTELVARAVAAGLVTATSSEHDGRVTEVRVSPEGESRMMECFARLGGERGALREALAGVAVGGLLHDVLREHVDPRALALVGRILRG